MSDIIGASRALNYEEPLLWELAQADDGGVDLPKLKKMALRFREGLNEC